MEWKMTETIRYASGQSSLGGFLAAASDRGLVMVAFADHAGAASDGLWARFPDAEIVEDPAALREAVDDLVGLIEHPETTFALPIDLRGSPFELRVWNALREIPAGETVSYGEIAARIGSPQEAREVAEACATNSLAVVVPCHRVVKKDGAISGYRWGVRRKRALIEREHRALWQLT
jgi:AraC family transcriptional regulator of adaptative response/methylated-DNA-[protein]-cysteine methyltransferase